MNVAFDVKDRSCPRLPAARNGERGRARRESLGLGQGQAPSRSGIILRREKKDTPKKPQSDRWSLLRIGSGQIASPLRPLPHIAENMATNQEPMSLPALQALFLTYTLAVWERKPLQAPQSTTFSRAAIMYPSTRLATPLSRVRAFQKVRCARRKRTSTAEGSGRCSRIPYQPNAPNRHVGSIFCLSVARSRVL